MVCIHALPAIWPLHLAGMVSGESDARLHFSWASVLGLAESFVLVFEKTICLMLADQRELSTSLERHDRFWPKADPNFTRILVI